MSKRRLAGREAPLEIHHGYTATIFGDSVTPCNHPEYHNKKGAKFHNICLYIHELIKLNHRLVD
jgi:hypothetical protein